MKIVLTTLLLLGVFCVLAQPKWAMKRPNSESGKFNYFLGTGESAQDAYLNAAQSMLQEMSIINVVGETSKAVEITEEMRKSKFETTTSVKVDGKDFFVFPVHYELEGATHYVLIGTPKVQSSTSTGGVMSKSQFIWRSSLLPGWGQFYNKEPKKGLFFSLGEVGLIGAAVFSMSESGKQRDQANLALLNGNLAQYNTYDQNAKTFQTSGNILLIGAGAFWLLNIIDATASSKNLYVFNDHKVKMNWVAMNNGLGINIKF
ncbi:MAG: DUF5683 domain-containing protein [Cyclobacteriaceae bacterium]